MKLIAYETVSSEGFSLVPAPHGRDWMDATHERSAYRCLPMVMANQAGWLITCPATVRVKWDGGSNLGSISILPVYPYVHLQCPLNCELADRSHIHMESAPEYWFPTSHFGSGIITWTLPWLFRTPEGYNLLARGPANYPKDGISPLEGLVETDWAVSTFTMNWKITRPDEWITFEEGEPICMVVPQRRDELEEFSPEVSSIESDPELAASFEKWCESRDQFNDARKDPESEAAKKGWEKHYVKGTAPDGSVASEHRTKMRLKGFAKHE